MRTIQISTLGKNGRFGNSVGQYIFAKTYAEITDSILEIPHDWIGRKIFKIAEKERSITKILPTIEEGRCPIFIKDSKGNLITNIDLYGFFQNPKFYNLISLTKCREWLQIKDKWNNKFRKIKPFYIACHLRRGDFVTQHHSYPVIQEAAYLQAVYRENYNPNDVVWISEDVPKLDSECASLGIDFLPDFMTLINSDVLFRGPSTFSFWAGIIGCCKIYSPVYDFPDYGNKVGFLNDVNFKLGLGPNKEGVFKI